MANVKNPENLKREKNIKLQRQRQKAIESMLGSDDDVDMSTVGQKWENGRFTVVAETDPVRSMLKQLLAIRYGVELASIGFLVVLFAYVPLSEIEHA